MNNLDIKQIRYKNAVTLRNLAGGVSDFAKKVDRSQPQMSNVVGDNPIKPIGHKLARYFESVFDKPQGWMDTAHPEIWQPDNQQEVLHNNLTPAELLAQQLKQFASEGKLSPDDINFINNTLQHLVKLKESQDAVANGTAPDKKSA